MNKYKKGSRLEKEFDDYLKSKGFITHRARKNVIMKDGRVFAQRNDLFGLFDILALKRNYSPLLFQVSSEFKRGKARKDIEDFAREFNSVKVFMVRKKKNFEIIEFVGDKWVKVYDFM